MSILETVTTNLRDIRSRIEDACVRADRNTDSVQLVAVTKYAQPDWIQALLDAGHTLLGESRPQQLCRRATEFPSNIEWHLIGHLQRNKVDLVLPAVSMIHSIDSLRLLKKIDSAASTERRPEVLLEINASGEEVKDGLSPDELRELWPEISSLERVSVRGLMTMAPRCSDPEEARPAFRTLRNLRDELAASSGDGESLPHLSMGMSGDFEVAVEAGATLVRVGSSLFTGLS